VTVQPRTAFCPRMTEYELEVIWTVVKTLLK
jgi:hypothetical protein